MIEQLKTIRCIPLESCAKCPYSVGRQTCSKAQRDFEGGRPGSPPDWCPLPALHPPVAQLEAMVGEQEPKFWYRPVGNDGLYEGPVHHNSIGGKMLRDEKPGEWVPLFEGAAPAAQQYEAGDMASAAAQGFRDGVASVAQPQEPVALSRDEQRLRLWQAIQGAAKAGVAHDDKLIVEELRQAGYCIAAAPVAQQPQAPTESVLIDGIAYDIPAPVAAELLRLHIEAQQPQARPDFTDEWTGYLKDGETPFERFLRERKDMQSVLKLYQRVLEENERLKAQQQQAEAVSDDLRDRLVAIGQAIADQDDRAAQAMIREILAAPQQAEVTKTVATHDDTDLIEQMLDALRSCSGVPHWPALIPTINAARKRLETPQQAEAVPPAQAELLTDATLLALWSGDDSRPVLGKNKVLAFARAIEQSVLSKRVPQWLPIETAPKGQRVMVWIADKEAGENIAFAKVWFHADGTLGGGAEGFNGKWDLTHWMPLPPPPGIVGEKGGA